MRNLDRFFIDANMHSEILIVKNMVCSRCVMAVENILKKSELPFQKVLIGEIHLSQPLKPNQKQTLKNELEKVGFEMIDNHVSGLIEKIKKYVIKKARKEAEDKKENLSTYLSHHLHHEYTYLSSLFSSIEGRTIENYFIEQRIEKAKELIVYGQMTLSEIADALEYSSVAHLSSQFKKVTGLTPSYFKEIGAAKRKGLDRI
ncbi:MAG TPA: helix-turn-helix transcriptional regulator [Bacteroidia bacterium]|nr:helix-turn-helix transcriptional regulator [Bacteroidia bacterium]